MKIRLKRSDGKTSYVSQFLYRDKPEVKERLRQKSKEWREKNKDYIKEYSHWYAYERKAGTKFGYKRRQAIHHRKFMREYMRGYKNGSPLRREKP